MIVKVSEISVAISEICALRLLFEYGKIVLRNRTWGTLHRQNQTKGEICRETFFQEERGDGEK